MSTHTPGPWRIEGHPKYPYILGGNVYVATVEPATQPKRHAYDAPGAAADANARLIAAAPEMRERLARVASITHDVFTYGNYADVDLLRDEYTSIRALLARIDGTEGGTR